MNHRPKTLALVVGGIFAAAPVLAQEAKPDERTTAIGTISITGEGDKLGAGQMIQEETPKARSTVTRAALDKMRSTSSPYQALNLLPGVNASSFDATGLFGGNLRVRGFNSDQMGFTVDGAPVNDSGSFSVFPQEYTDLENTCELFVTQGSADNDAPHVGATGGNIGLVTCDPLPVAQMKVQQTIGQLDFAKTFARVDTGRLAVANGWMSFLSVSHAEVDKFRGLGKARRDHLDMKTVMDLPGGSRLSFTGIFNSAVNNNYRTITKAQYDNDHFFDFSQVFLPNPPGGPGRQTPPAQDTYYRLSLNPFQNAILTGKANINLTPAMRFDLEPYFWYGYGTGGTQQFTLNEGGTFRGGVQDVNGDGDRLDAVLVYRSSLTKTRRPGATARFNWALANHRVALGYWYERAWHRQTGPATRINADAEAADLWLRDQLIVHADGTPFQLRDQLTISKAGSIFAQDSIGLLNDRLNVQIGVKRPFIDRDFTNFANDGTGQGVDYHARKRFEKTLPSVGVRYQLTDAHQVFVNAAQNFKAPGNFVWQGAIVNGVNRIDQINATLKAETSTNVDVGYRYLGRDFTFSGSVYAVNFKDRLARQFLPQDGIVVDTNVGDSTIRGFEVEAGTRPFAGWSVYGSLSYTKSKLKSDLAVSATNIQPTSGKEFPDTPRWLAGVSVQYATGPFYASVQAKFTGKRFSTLTNDQEVSSYTVVDFNTGYRLEPMGMLKNPTLRLSMSNVFDRSYLLLNSGSGSLFTTNATGTGAAQPQYFVGAPRFTSVAFSVEF